MDDTISRQMAIDVLGKIFPADPMRNDYTKGITCGAALATEYIKQLPSAQQEQRWISCSERLPEHGGRYLISVLDGINRRTTVAPYLPRCKAWAMNGRMAYWKVIAWMPLPKPYKEERKDNE